MGLWLLRRILQAMGVVLVMTVIVFVGLNFVGNPVDILLSPEADAVERARLTRDLGLDLPLWRQYLAFLHNALQGGLGISFVYNQPALGVILERMPATLELALVAMALSCLIGIPLGLLAGLAPRSIASRLTMTVSVLGFSLPSFWVALMLIMVFSVELGWLPAGGRGETAAFLGVEWSFLTLDGLAHLLLPALNLALFKVSLIIRLVRAGVLENMSLDYVKFARAKGLHEARIVFVHVLRNILLPVITVIALEFGSVLAFSVVTETIFVWPGMGKLIIDSINLLDRPMIVAYLMVIVCIFVLLNLIADILYTLLDPRVRLRN